MTCSSVSALLTVKTQYGSTFLHSGQSKRMTSTSLLQYGHGETGSSISLLSGRLQIEYKGGGGSSSNNNNKNNLTE